MKVSPGRDTVIESLKRTSKGRLSYDTNWHFDNSSAQEEKRPVVPLPLSSPPKSGRKSDCRIRSPKIQENETEREVAAVQQQSAHKAITTPEEKSKRLTRNGLQASSLELVGLLVSHGNKVEESVKAEWKQRKIEFLAGMERLRQEALRLQLEVDSKTQLKYQHQIKIIDDLQKRTESYHSEVEQLQTVHDKRKHIATKNQERIRTMTAEIISEKKQIEENRLKKLGLSKNLESLALSARDLCKNIFNELETCAGNQDLSEVARHLHGEASKQYTNAIGAAKNAITDQEGLEDAVNYLERCIEALNKIRDTFTEHVSKLDAKRKEEDQRKAEEIKVAEEKRTEEEGRREAAEKLAAATPTASAPSFSQAPPGVTPEQATAITNIVSPNAFKTYQETLKYQQDLCNSYAELTNSSNGNAAMIKEKKAFRFQLTKVINTPINSISDQSPSHLIDKIERLSKLLKGEPVPIGDKVLRANDHPNGLAYCKDVVAKKLVLQGANQISSSFNSAFSFAAVALGIWAELPDVGQLILAHFYQACPYLVPYYVPRTPGQSVEDYFQLLGYDVNGKEIETEEKYLKKLSGIVRLYAAIVQSPMPAQLSSLAHPYGIHNGWTWLTRLLNLEPRQTVTATVLFDFLEVAGYSLSKTYGKQFQKVLRILLQNVMPKIDAVTPADQKGPVVRLKSFLEKCIKSGSIPLPAGYLSPRWWSQ